MASTRRSLRSAARMQANAEAPTTADTTVQPQKGKKPLRATKASSKSQSRISKSETQPQDKDIEAVQTEKAIRLAEIEDELAKRAEEAKASHPRQRVTQQDELPIPKPAQQHLPQEYERGLYKPRVPSTLSENGNSSSGALGQKDVSTTSPKSAQLADEIGGKTRRDEIMGKSKYGAIGLDEDVPVDGDIEVYDPDLSSHDTDADGEALRSAVPPVKTPRKNLNKAVEKKKKAKGDSLRVRMQSNRQTASPGSKFQKPPVLVDEQLFETPATKKNLTNSVQSWAQGLRAPPAKKQKISKSRSATSVTTSDEPINQSRSLKSCTTVVEPAGYLPPPRRSQLQGASRGKKRQVEQLTSDSDTPSDVLPPSPLPHKRHEAVELSSDAESGPQLPLRKCPTAAVGGSKSYRKDKHNSHLILPPPPQAKRTTTTASRQKAHVDQSYDSSDPSSDDTSAFQAQKPPIQRYPKVSRGKRRRMEERTSDSDDQAPPPPKRKPGKAVSRTKNRFVEDLYSDTEEAGLASTLYGGLQDEDDIAEQNAAVASPIRPRAAARKSKASLKLKPEITTVSGPRNSSLPHGALEHNRWSSFFLPTFLKHVGGMQHDIWSLNETETLDALQRIWNQVYSGEKPVGGSQVVHVIGSDVYAVVIQRVTEWRSSIGSAALVVVNDFLDSLKLYTTEDRQEAAANLLFCERYVYHRTRDVVENGVKKLMKNGRYRGPLIIYTVAQHLIDTENAINVPGLIEDSDFPKAAIALSAVAVHRALELWVKGYITYDSYYEAKTKNLKTGGITKVIGPDGISRKTTNFGRKQYEQWSDQHCSDVWLVDDGKMQVVMADARKAVDVILSRNGVPKRMSYTEGEAGPSRRAVCIESDPEFWYADWFF